MPFTSKVRTHVESRRHERDVARQIGGRTTRGSGAGSDKGDAKSATLRVECKCTRRKSYGVSIETMDKITEAAVQTGQSGVLHIRFLDERGRAIREYAVVEAHRLGDLT